MAYSSITKPSNYFNTKLYSGNASTQAITGVGFQPDWCWFKGRNFADNHVFIDAVRGTNKAVYSDTTGAETTQTHYFTSFDSDGYTLGNSGIMNGSSKTYASWNWKAGTTSGITTNGSTTITPTAYSFNQTAGFSIIKYNGNSGGSGYNALIPHGLGVAPKVIIVKQLNYGTEHWGFYHASLGNTKTLFLNKTDDEYGATNMWYDTSPDTVNFSVGINDIVNNTNADYIAYCFAEKTGYSKFGSYVGNGNADGTFVYTGFKPAWVMTKNASSSATSWIISDNKRNTSNVMNTILRPDNSGAEQTFNYIDHLSNGFKLRYSSDSNTNGNTIIYMAFAEEPLVANVGSSIPATAR